LLVGLCVIAGSAAATERGPAAALPWHVQALARLDAAVLRYQAIAAGGGWPALPPGPSLKPGATDPRVPVLRRILLRTGDLADAAATSPTFDPALVAAVTAFQARHGLETDGIVGPRTTAAVNVPAAERLAALRRNRARLDAFTPAFADYVLINIPAYEGRLIRGPVSMLDMRVVVGQRGWPTPRLTSRLDRLVFNPAWNVPRNIKRKEMIPKAQADPDYLRRQNIRVYAGGRAVDPASVDWSSPEAETYHLQQPPGRGNALGKVKFLFDNRYQVLPARHPLEAPVPQGAARLQPWLRAAGTADGPGPGAVGGEAGLGRGGHRCDGGARRPADDRD
jgi:murein L,D-transpeptidase YcbB/YkuD